MEPLSTLSPPRSSIFCFYLESESEHFVKNLQNVLDVPYSIFELLKVVKDCAYSHPSEQN